MHPAWLAFARLSMNNPTILYAGIDVAKSSFQLHWRGASHQLPNNPKGHARLLALLGGPAHNHVVMEATGGYERPIASALRAGGYRLSVVEPGRVRAFARAQGLRAKNDPIDAAVIGAFGQAIEPAPTPAPSPEQERLAELVTRRAQLVNMKVAETNHREHYRDALAQRQAAALLRTLAGQIAQMEKEIARLLAAAAPMQARADRIQQVPGVGPIVAATLQAYMPELGTLSAASAAALAGVAPYDRQSGPWVGQRRISGGRAPVRCALYLATLSAVRHDPVFKATYTRLRAAGKKPLVALTAVMRKLIVLLNHLLKNPSFKLRGTAAALSSSPTTPRSGAGEAPV